MAPFARTRVSLAAEDFKSATTWVGCRGRVWTKNQARDARRRLYAAGGATRNRYALFQPVDVTEEVGFQLIQLRVEDFQ
jgi:hypothetical protein